MFATSRNISIPPALLSLWHLDLTSRSPLNEICMKPRKLCSEQARKRTTSVVESKGKHISQCQVIITRSTDRHFMMIARVARLARGIAKHEKSANVH
ncbi:hypothetical protein CEXT_454741 [Caerostris extrusa]|uniref:Uncharacterized protein n=1 Tax=Caerostris extrusa TaxID=172846 RepID=A0AAV4SB61_CAEEX|nr:hypothetical protein CEXT_454741 [Caerostris extrusa]